MVNEQRESCNRDRYEVIGQDSATQMLQAYPCTTKTSQETMKSLQEFLQSKASPKVIYADNALELGNACEDLQWFIVRQGLIVPRQFVLQNG